MEIYNTYQEAKIANPKDGIKTDNLGNFFISVGHDLCKPKDYCITVGKFLRDGYRFTKGDIVFEGRVKYLFTDSLVGIWNKTNPSDASDAYILRAATLEKQKPIPNPEAVEWKNGDECLYMGGNFVFIGMLCVPTLKGTADCMIQHEDGAPIMAKVSELSKPESPEDKEIRELYEAIENHYDLAPDGLDIPITKHVAKMLIQQGYRKGE